MGLQVQIYTILAASSWVWNKRPFHGAADCCYKWSLSAICRQAGIVQDFFELLSEATTLEEVTQSEQK